MLRIIVSTAKLAILTVSFAAYSLVFPYSVYASPDLNKLPSGDYQLDLGHASIVWRVSHLGLSNYVGRFNDFDAILQLDTENYSNSSVTVDIKTASIDTDYPYSEKKDFNKKLRMGKSWFNGDAFPKISFVSTSLKPINEKQAKLIGNLTFLGVTKPVTLDVVFNKAMESHPFANVPAIGFSAKTNIKRSEWGFDTNVPKIGDDVSIEIEAEFLKKD